MVGIVLIGIFSVVGFGATAIEDSTSDVTDETAERDLIRLAESVDRQTIDSDSTLGTRDADIASGDITSSTSSVRTVDSAGDMEIQVAGSTVLDDSLGMVEYENPDSDTRIAYQGGLVVSKQGNTPAAILRENEFRYREDGAGVGITMHVMTLDEFASLDDSASITVDDVSEQWPDLIVNAGDTIEITIESEYHYAWARKFDEMLPASQTTINHDTVNNRVEVTYTAPSDGAFFRLIQYDAQIG